MRTVVMQEMLHYAQAANLLIAVGGKVVLDSPNAIPSYPRKDVPDGVLHNMYIALKKFTLATPSWPLRLDPELEAIAT